MDPLTALLDAPRASGAFLLRVTMSPPWSVRVQDEAPLAVVAVTGGRACYAPDVGDPVHLGAGDLLLIARPDPYLFADSPDRAPQAVIHPGGRCETPLGGSLELPMRQGVRSWGNAAQGRDVMLVGSYPRVSEVAARLIRALPPSVLVRADEHRTRLIDVLAEEIQGEGIGQAALLDRLLDGLTVSAIRHWAHSAASAAPGWLHAGADRAIGSALDLMHERAEHPWTVASLAQRVGLSRAGFSRRFVTAVGEPPMAYLTSWRLALAADLLRQEDLPVFRVASEVGYASPFTFSTAFKRHYGVSPLGWRQRGAQPADTDVPAS
ncbi:AraC family transcriptional regulator [Streptomyces sp. XM4193]|uniref:AraC family transcriptional regulator n=1 Tax=Streptomyces sp. XM4193 TaxID=2929782 RepID=UPI001FF92132|nr:AraC family transcriptional regulator [Streptomyces sp. XM4193]MCK1794639.1 AraC family transcriptional regulator [Streptomyces sp. XM4193]